MPVVLLHRVTSLIPRFTKAIGSAVLQTLLKEDALLEPRMGHLLRDIYLLDRDEGMGGLTGFWSSPERRTAHGGVPSARDNRVDL
jgi:hypothetical protein